MPSTDNSWQFQILLNAIKSELNTPNDETMFGEVKKGILRTHFNKQLALHTIITLGKDDSAFVFSTSSK